jgi:SAM-dependent MidA family methyltransferase
VGSAGEVYRQRAVAPLRERPVTSAAMAVTPAPSTVPRAARLPAPDAPAREHAARVLAYLRARIAAAGGWLPFDAYMHEVLYAPGLGYYAAGARKFGDSASGGDFVTAPEISPLFGRALARQVAQILRQSAPQVVEFGAGSGALAEQLIEALAQQGFASLRYAIVEVSPDLRARQQSRLRGLAVEWLDAPPPGIDGVIIANEVLDVMPVTLFAVRRGAVFERGVAGTGEGLALQERPAAAALSAEVAAIEADVGAFADGYESEIGFAAQAWAAALAGCIGRGAALMIDYGFPRREYYHPHRLMGTLMCHYRHHAHADPLWLPGLNDITAHVDFSALALAAQAAGLDVLGYTSQSHFLLNCGLLDLLQAAHSPAAAGAAHRLVSEAEMGELVKVFAVGRGIDAALLGFTRGDRRHRL